VAKRILTVDDSPSMLQVQKLILSGAGYEVLQAVDGRDALLKLAGAKVQLVLTDLNMPNMDGVEFLRAVRATPEHRLTPILMVTTESRNDRKQEGKAAGATGWITKPFTADQLLSVVKRVLG
jgi:two-component system, chemotaxis family, chemotaxis protein CheY